MRLRALALLLLLLPLPVRAEGPPADAPLAIQKGAPAPADGVFLTTPTAAKLAATCQRTASESSALAKALEQKPPEVAPGWGVVLLGTGAGAALGLLVGALLFKK